MMIQDNPSADLYDQLRGAVLAVRPTDAPNVDRYAKTYAITKKDDGGKLQGGAYVYVHPGWAYIDLVWVDSRARGKGVGRRLMEEAEAEAQRRGCHSAYLWTQDYEAPGFYEKLGYRKFVELDNFIPGHQRIGFMKRIAE